MMKLNAEFIAKNKCDTEMSTSIAIRDGREGQYNQLIVLAIFDPVQSSGFLKKKLLPVVELQTFSS